MLETSSEVASEKIQHGAAPSGELWAAVVTIDGKEVYRRTFRDREMAEAIACERACWFDELGRDYRDLRRFELADSPSGSP